MTIIEAIRRAREKRVNVVNTKSFSYRAGLVPEHDQTDVVPGKIHPDYLITIIGNIYEEDLLADIWDIEEETITLTYSQWVNFMRCKPSYIEDPTALSDVRIWNMYWNKLKEITE